MSGSGAATRANRNSYARRRFLRRDVPAEVAVDRSAPNLPICARRGRIVHQTGDRRCELRLVVRCNVDRGVAAETRVSFRSNETMGFPSAMYSMTLIHVETSLSGLDGFGSRQMSAVER